MNITVDVGIKAFEETDMEKQSSSLAVLAEIFDEVAEISRKVCCYLVIILAEYNIEWKT